MWVSNLRLVSNLSVNIIPPNSKRERDTVSEKYVNMFFPKISVFPVSSEARNTTSAAFLSVFFHFLARSRPEHSRAEMSHNNKNWAPSRKPVKGIQTVPTSSLATRIRGELVCVTSVRMAGESDSRENVPLLHAPWILCNQNHGFCRFLHLSHSFGGNWGPKKCI